jgi:type II secretory pathway pseudopilin PulG
MRPHSAGGFSLVELIVAIGLTLIMTAAIFDLVGQSRHRFDAEPEAVERQQRIRVAVDALLRDLLMASAVMPYQAAGPSPDPPGTFKDDVVTIVSEQAAAADTIRTYYLRRNAAPGGSQLMRAEGGGGDAPVVDGVTGLSFTYFGDAPAGSGGPGAACAVASGVGSLVPIGALEFSDGPWCPGAAGEPVDADVLRIRKIGVRISVSPIGVDLDFNVTPRNLNQGR